MKKEFGNFSQVFKDLYTFKGNEKKTTLSKEGFITVQADASAIAGTYNITVEKLQNAIKLPQDQWIYPILIT